MVKPSKHYLMLIKFLSFLFLVWLIAIAPKVPITVAIKLDKRANKIVQEKLLVVDYR